MIRVNIDVVDAAALLVTHGAGALIRVERAPTLNGSYAEIGTIALVSGTDDYVLWDPGGAATSWYRWRASNAGGTVHSAYSAKFQGIDVEDPDAAGRYASLGDVLGAYRQDVDDRLRTQLDDALVDATRQISSLMGFDVLRHPTSGTEVFTVEAHGSSRLCVHDGIVPASVTGVEVRGSIHTEWEELDAADWELETPEQSGYPAFHLWLTGVATAPRSRWPHGRSLVRVTGARGWPAIPDDWSRATRDRARQMVGWDATRPGGPTGPEELGASVGPNRMPDTMYRLRHDYSAWELGLAQCDL